MSACELGVNRYASGSNWRLIGEMQRSSVWVLVIGLAVVFPRTVWSWPTGRLIEERVIERNPEMDPYKVRQMTAESMGRLPGSEFSQEDIRRVLIHGDTGNPESNKRVYEGFRDALADPDFVAAHSLHAIDSVDDPHQGEMNLRTQLHWDEHVSDVGDIPTTDEAAAVRYRTWMMILDRSKDAPVAFSMRKGKLFVDLRRNGYALAGELSLSHDPKQFVEDLTRISSNGKGATDIFIDAEAARVFRSLDIPMEGWRFAFGYKDLHQLGEHVYVEDMKQLKDIEPLVQHALPTKRAVFLLDADVDGQLAAALRERCGCRVIEASQLSLEQVANALQAIPRGMAIFVGHLEADHLGHGRLPASELTKLANEAGVLPMILGCNSSSVPGGVVIGQLRLNPLIRRLTAAFEKPTIQGFLETVATPANPLVLDEHVVDAMNNIKIVGHVLDLHDEAATGFFVGGSTADASIRIEVVSEVASHDTRSIEVRNIPLTVSVETHGSETVTLNDVRSGIMTNRGDERERIMRFINSNMSRHSFGHVPNLSEHHESGFEKIEMFFVAIVGLLILVILVAVIAEAIWKRLKRLFTRRG